MVSEKGDIPDRDDVEPPESDIGFLRELIKRGEVSIKLVNGAKYELHHYDTYVFEQGNGIVYTQNEDEDEVWFYASAIVNYEQH